MSKGPKVHEIFSNSALGKNTAFVFENQETKQQIHLSKKKNAAAPSGMKKFGGYKPKILGDQSDFLSIQKNADDASRALSGGGESRTNQTLTKPKPWVIGDKDVPMVLAPLHDEHNDSVDENGNNHENSHLDDMANGFGHFYDGPMKDLEDSLRTQSIHSDTSTLVSYSSDPDRGLDNPAASFMSSVETLPAHDIKSAHGNGKTHLQEYAPLGNDHLDTVSGDLYIPAPDYDEEERTIDFTSEDTDDPDSPEDRHISPKARPLSKVYGGEDFSRYLTDEEDESQVELRHKTNKNTLSRKSSSEAPKPKVSQKHSMFKQNPQAKNKRHSAGSNSGFSSVRNFSYADSKFGTSGRSKSKNMQFTEATDDGDVFLSANTQQSSYESFLRTRNGDTLPLRSSTDSGVDMGEDGHFIQQRVGNKGDTLWKKMTLRFKHKLSKVN